MDEEVITNLIRDLKKPLILIAVLVVVFLWVNISNRIQFSERNSEQEKSEKQISYELQTHETTQDVIQTPITKTEQPKKQSANNDVRSRSIVGEDWFGFSKKEDLNNATEYANNGDKEAWASAMTKGMLNGTIIRFKNGEKIFVKDIEMFSGIVKLRRKGDTKEYWTNYEAIQEPK